MSDLLTDTISKNGNPIAKVLGEPLQSLPEDLYIPPEALRVFLEAFEGPLDLLLYLIRKHNLDILDIPIALITDQYMEYVALMHELDLALVGEYLLMSATLAEIKSSMLLPRQKVSEEESIEDPRAELVRRLQTYQLFQEAADNLDSLPRFERDLFIPDIQDLLHKEIEEPTVTLDQLLAAFKLVLKRSKLYTHHAIERELLSVREKMSYILKALPEDDYALFSNLFVVEEGRLGVIVSFMAVLELVKQTMIELTQNTIYGPIYVRRKHHDT